MHLRRNSKLLAKANEDNYYVMIYHNTPVVFKDNMTGQVSLKHNGFHTKATAAAMNYGLDDIYGENNHQRVSLVEGELMMDKTTPISNGEVFNYTDLEVA